MPLMMHDVRPQHRRSSFLAIVLSALMTATVAASVSVPTEFREIVADAELIVRGHVTDVRAINVRGVGVESVATIAVDATLKGQSDGFVSVRVPGGEIGRYRYVMVGAPTLRLNQSAIFFLKRGADNAWRPVGLASGIVSVDRDAATGRPVVHPPIMATGRTGGGPLLRGDARRKSLPVADYESLVRMVVAARTAQARPGR